MTPKPVVVRRPVKFLAALMILGGVVQAMPARAETATLAEQDDKGDPAKHFTGSVTWQVGKEAHSGRAAPLEVRADIVFPERGMSVLWVLRRNTDRSLPATHTIEVKFKLPANFPSAGITTVPGVAMKATEQARGTPLAGVTAKVTNEYFLIGLSALPGDAKLNADLLRDEKWLDILVVYANGTRAIVTAEKGAAGEHAFAEAFAAWAK